jgi:type II secretory pathway pseudopilin PulG
LPLQACPAPQAQPARRQRGFTYLLLLFALVAGSAALAALATAWSAAAQRQRERESQFRGQQIADAIGRYAMVAAIADTSANLTADTSAGADGANTAGTADTPTTTAAGQGPVDLAELLDDTRTPVRQRHLRRLYEDPLTGQADWVLLRNAQGRIEALHSRSNRPAVLSRNLDGAARVSDRVYRPRQPMPSTSLPLPHRGTE